MDEPEATSTGKFKTLFVEFRGKLVMGRYQVDRGIVTATSRDGRSKAMAAWPSAVESVARILLMELEQERLRGTPPSS
jgi:hypothetical protein